MKLLYYKLSRNLEMLVYPVGLLLAAYFMPTLIDALPSIWLLLIVIPAYLFALMVVSGMVAEWIYGPYIGKKFEIGQKVVVSSEGGWQQDSTAMVISAPSDAKTRQGVDYFYWVEFFEPQHDLSEDDPYESAQVLSRYLFCESEKT